MGDKKEEGRRSILGNLGDVFIPRSRSSSPKPESSPALSRFDLSKCHFHEKVTIPFVYIFPPPHPNHTLFHNSIRSLFQSGDCEPVADRCS